MHARWSPRRGRSTLRTWFALPLGMVMLLGGCANPIAPASQAGTGVGVKVVTTQAAAKPFDPNVGAPLPYNRLLLGYGYADSGNQVNGPASSCCQAGDLLPSYLATLQQLGQQYAALDPTHPVRLGIDLVVDTFAPCSVSFCSGWTGDISNYVQYCQQHNLLLFLDLQLGTEPVTHALTTKQFDNGTMSVLDYLGKYSFVELEIDTEFHFPNTPQGYAEAEAYDGGTMPASELNWAIGQLAQIPAKYHVPRKVLVTDQWYNWVFQDSSGRLDKDDIKSNPNVSLVLQSDGFGAYSNKLGDYQIFNQQDLLEYAGYKLFYYYGPGSTSYDFDGNGTRQIQSPQEVMQLFPQPLYISYQ
jgi:hypothetical protein